MKHPFLTILNVFKSKLFPNKLYDNTYIELYLNVVYQSFKMVDIDYVNDWMNNVINRLFERSNNVYGLCGLNVSYEENNGCYNYAFSIRSAYPILMTFIFNRTRVLDFFNWLIIKPIPQFTPVYGNLYFNTTFKLKADNAIVPIEKKNYMFDSKSNTIKLLK